MFVLETISIIVVAFLFSLLLLCIICCRCNCSLQVAVRKKGENTTFVQTENSFKLFKFNLIFSLYVIVFGLHVVVVIVMFCWFDRCWY